MGLTRPKFSQVNTSTSGFDDTVLAINTSDVRKPNGDRPDQGFIFQRYNADNIGIIWDEPNAVLKFISTTDTDSYNGQISTTGYVPVATANLTVNGNAAVTGNVTVAGNIVCNSMPVLKITTGAIGYVTGTSLLPADNTTPLKTEGSELFAVTLTPTTSSSKFTFQSSLMVQSSSNGRYISLALFRDNTCIHANTVYATSSNYGVPLQLLYTDSPSTTNNVTYSLRVGISSSATWYINTTSGSIRFNGLTTRNYVIFEHN